MAGMVRDSTAFSKMRHTGLPGRIKEKNKRAVTQYNCFNRITMPMANPFIGLYSAWVVDLISLVDLPVGFIPRRSSSCQTGFFAAPLAPLLFGSAGFLRWHRALSRADSGWQRIPPPEMNPPEAVNEHQRRGMFIPAYLRKALQMQPASSQARFGHRFRTG